MSNLLINESPLMVLPSLAKAIGLNEAIMLQQVHYWLKHAKVKHDGKMWIYKTFEEWKEQDFDFWSLTTIRRTAMSLRKLNLLLVEKLANNSFDRVNHYTVNYEQLMLIDTKQAVTPVKTDMSNMDASNRTEWTQHESNMDASDMSNMDACLRDKKENTKEINNNNNKIDFSLSDSIKDWVQPKLTEINQMLKLGQSVSTDITQSQYDYHLAKFKNFHAEAEAKGLSIQTEARRKDLLVEWIERDYIHQLKIKAKVKPIASSPSSTNTDWSLVGTTPDHSGSDLPDVFHPSHSKPTTSAKRDPKTSVMVNGLFKEPFPGMSVNESYEHISHHRSPGEMADETYDRLLNDLQEKA